MAADQAALQLRCARRAGCGASRARRSRSRRRSAGAASLGERVDRRRGCARSRASASVGELDRRAVARDGDDVLERRRADADGDRAAVHPWRAHSTGRGPTVSPHARPSRCLSSETLRPMANAPAAAHALQRPDAARPPRRAAARRRAIARDLGLPRSTTYHLLGVLATRASSCTCPRSAATASASAAFELGSAYAAPGAAALDRADGAHPARRRHDAQRPPRGAARARRRST